MTKHYDETNPEHVSIKEGIEEGNGILTLTTEEDVIDGLRSAGFEVR